MFLFNKRTNLVDIGIFDGFTDYHCHILPAVDDGIQAVEESLDTLNHYESLGVSTVIFTPHVMQSIGVEQKEVVQRFVDFKKLYSGTIKLKLAAEYMLDSGFNTQMENGLRLLEDDKVLVETSYYSKPQNMYQILYEIQEKEIIPVIAHPERYMYMEFNEYKKLKNNDYMLQLNLMSLSGCYGSRVTKNAWKLLEEGMYDRIGSDLHNLEKFKSWINAIKVTKKQEQLLLKLKEKC